MNNRVKSAYGTIKEISERLIALTYRIQAVIFSV